MTSQKRVVVHSNLWRPTCLKSVWLLNLTAAISAVVLLDKILGYDIDQNKKTDVRLLRLSYHIECTLVSCPLHEIQLAVLGIGETRIASRGNEEWNGKLGPHEGLPLNDMVRYR